MSEYKIILVDENNLTTSILAEAICKKILQIKGISNVEITSRGMVVLFSEPISPKAAAVLHEHECEEVTRRSTGLTQEDVDSADLILAINKAEVDHIKEDFICQKTCMFLGTFIDMEDELPAVKEDTKEAYEACYQTTKQAMEAMIERLILELVIV